MSMPRRNHVEFDEIDVHELAAIFAAGVLRLRQRRRRAGVTMTTAPPSRRDSCQIPPPEALRFRAKPC